jgi:hypothetical protein
MDREISLSIAATGLCVLIVLGDAIGAPWLFMVVVRQRGGGEKFPCL